MQADLRREMEIHAATAARVCAQIHSDPFPAHAKYLDGFARVMRDVLLPGFDAARQDPELRAGLYHTSGVLYHQFYLYEHFLRGHESQ